MSVYHLKGIFFLVFIYVLQVGAYEFCQSDGSTIIYCDYGTYCCNNNFECCTSGLSTGAIAGIVIGAVVAKFLLIAACVWACKRRNRRPPVMPVGIPVQGNTNPAYATQYAGQHPAMNQVYATQYAGQYPATPQKPPPYPGK